MNDPRNSFTVDKSAGVLGQLTEAQKDELLQQLLSRPAGKEFDLNAPVVIRTPYKEFPKAVYHHGSGRVVHVEDQNQLDMALKRGFEEKPAPDRDYSKINLAGIAAMKAEAPPREKEFSSADLAAMEQEEATVNAPAPSDDQGADLAFAPEDPQIQPQGDQQVGTQAQPRRSRR